MAVCARASIPTLSRRSAPLGREGETELSADSRRIRGAGELFERISKRDRYSEADAAVVMKQLLVTLNYLHVEKKIAHCDLKVSSARSPGPTT